MSLAQLTDRISLAAYISNYLYDNGMLRDNAANLVFDRLTDALELLTDEQIRDLVQDVASHRQRVLDVRQEWDSLQAHLDREFNEQEGILHEKLD